MRAEVLRPFFTRCGGRIWEAGELFDGTPAQVAKLAERGLVAAAEPEVKAPEEPKTNPEPKVEGFEAQDLSKLTNAQLSALCAERGIEVPKRAGKQQLLKLLG